MNEENQQPESYTQTQFASNNAGYFGANALEIRLNTRTILQKIEMNLRGSYIEQVQNPTTGEWILKEVETGKPLVNSEGLQNIMNHLEGILNPQVAQGNFQSFEMYFDYLVRTRKDLATFLMNNMHEFGISPLKYPGIISSCMRPIEAFMSRLVNDGERKSYAATIRSSENFVSNPKAGGIRLPWGK